MKINFSLDLSPEELSTLANAEVDMQRIREEVRRDANFEREYDAIKKHIDENRRRVDAMAEDFRRDFERVSFEIEKVKKEMGNL